MQWYYNEYELIWKNVNLMNEMEQMNATQQFSGNVTIRFYSWDFGQEIFCRGLFSRANKDAGYKGASGAVLGQTSGGCQGGMWW